MKLIPVLDLLNGVTVQAVAGRRSEYRPIRSVLTDSVDPSIVLPCLNDVCRSGRAYVADLDAILHGKLNRCTLAELSRMEIELMVDAGIQSSDDAEQLFELGVDSAVIGLESLPGPDVARELLSHFGAESLIMSIDLQDGRLLAAHKPWVALSPLELLCDFAALGFQRWIILDLAVVGTADGVSTIDLCRQLRQLRPDDEIITGGGVRDAADLRTLEDSGIDGVLIASALHNGSLSVDT